MKQIEKKEKVRKVFLDDLPRWRFGKTKTEGEIDWKNSIGYKVKGVYEGLNFEIEIIDYNIKTNKLSIKYKNKVIHEIFVSSFINCQLKILLRNELYEYQYNENNSRRVDLRKLPSSSKGIDWNKVANEKIKIPFVYDNVEGEVKVIDYSGKYLFIKYKDKPIFRIKTGNFQNCKLGKLLNKKTDEFKIEIGTIFIDDKRNIIIIDREYRLEYKENEKLKHNYKWYKYHCNKCGYEGWTTENQLLNKKISCSVCCPTPRVVVEHINSIVAKPETQWMIKYFQGGYDEAKLYTPSSGKKIKPICPDCGQIKNKAITIYSIYNNHSIGCNKCGDGQSYPSKFMFKLLTQLNIDFIPEYSPDWIKPKRFDFYFESSNKKYIVEMDGGWHKIDNNMSGKTKEESKAIDNYKDKLAKDHNIEVIRIDCLESNLDYIKNNILNSKLNNLFNFDKINWNETEEFALNNRVLEACKIKHDNSKLNTTEIGQIMKLNNNTIAGYLKKGSKLGWCEYDSKEEVRKNGKLKGKAVEIFKNEKSLGIFPSIMDLERKSEELFGVKLNSRIISQVCKKQRKHHHNFIFKYV